MGPGLPHFFGICEAGASADGQPEGISLQARYSTMFSPPDLVAAPPVEKVATSRSCAGPVSGGGVGAKGDAAATKPNDGAREPADTRERQQLQTHLPGQVLQPLIRASSDADVLERAQQAGGLQEPDDDHDDDDNIDDPLDLAVHRDVVVDQPEQDADNHQRDDEP